MLLIHDNGLKSVLACDVSDTYSIIACARDKPSYVDVPRPISSKMIKLSAAYVNAFVLLTFQP